MNERVKTALLGVGAMVPFVLLSGFSLGWDWVMAVAKFVAVMVLTIVAVCMFAVGILAVIGAFIGDTGRGGA